MTHQVDTGTLEAAEALNLEEDQTKGVVVATSLLIVAQHLPGEEEEDSDLLEEVDPSVQDATTYHNNLEPQSTSAILHEIVQERPSPLKCLK